MRSLLTVVILTVLALAGCAGDPSELNAPDARDPGSRVLARPDDAGNAEVFPSVIPLPDGFQPEGIAIGRGTTFYISSLAGGAIFRGDLRTGEGDIFVAPTGGVAVGLNYDPRRDHLFVAGGPLGTALVYDATTGELLATYQLTDPGTALINDLVITREGAYFTDSSNARLFFVPLGPGGDLLSSPDIEEIPLTGDYVNVEGQINANGIVATPNERWLLVVNSITGVLYRVDPETGEATVVDLGGASLEWGDGLLLQGRTLYVVRNVFNLIAVVELSQDFSSGEVVGTITDPDFDVPATVAAFGSSLYLPNARFTTPPGPDTEYWVARVETR